MLSKYHHLGFGPTGLIGQPRLGRRARRLVRIWARRRCRVSDISSAERQADDHDAIRCTTFAGMTSDRAGKKRHSQGGH